MNETGEGGRKKYFTILCFFVNKSCRKHVNVYVKHLQERLCKTGSAYEHVFPGKVVWVEAFSFCVLQNEHVTLL